MVMASSSSPQPQPQPQEQEQAKANPCWWLLDTGVHVKSVEEPIPDASTWKVIASGKIWRSCSCRRDDDDSAASDLTLLARFRPPPQISALRFQVSHAKNYCECVDVLPHCYGAVNASAVDLAVIYLFVGLDRHLIVCDVVASSLTVVPDIVTTITGSIPMKHADGRQALVTLYLENDPAAVCLWPLSPSPSPSSHWGRRKAIMPQFPPTLPGGLCFFYAHEEFSSRDMGMCFWVDLLQGVLYCKHDDLLPLSGKGEGGGDVQFHYIGLPPGTESDFHEFNFGLPELRLFRTMVVSGGSIMLATIGGPPYTRFSDHRTVTLWKLMPDLRHWEQDAEIKIGDTDKDCDIQIGHLLSNDTVWKVFNPVLSAEHPGVVNLALSICQPDKEYEARGIILCIDMREKRLLSFHHLPPSFNLYRPRLSGFNLLGSCLMDAEQE